MKKQILRPVRAAAGTACLVAALTTAPALTATADDEISSQARKELAAARAASARYHDIDAPAAPRP